MKLKTDLNQSIIIYFLTIITVIILLIIINFKLFNDYQEVKVQMNLITENNVKIIDDQGVNQNDKVSTDFKIEKQRRDRILYLEIILLILIIIIGFLILINDINQKIVLLENLLKDSIKATEQLQVIDSSSKYEEINQLILNINRSINRIKKKDQKRDELYEDMVHDFKTPLHIITGNVELAQHGIELNIDIVNKQLKRLKYLTELNLIKQENEEQVIEGEELSAYLHQVAKIYPHVDFILNIDQVIVFSTKVESLFRVIDNIINNAVKHGKPGKINIVLKEAETEIELAIINDGEEIDSELIDLIFNRKNPSISTGLGLNIVNSILEQLNYQLITESNPSSTSFKIIIPKTK